MEWAVLVKLMPTNRPNMSPSMFFDDLKFKIQNNFGSFLSKKLLQTKIGIGGINSSAHGYLAKKIKIVYLFKLR